MKLKTSVVFFICSSLCLIFFTLVFWLFSPVTSSFPLMLVFCFFHLLHIVFKFCLLREKKEEGFPHISSALFSLSTQRLSEKLRSFWRPSSPVLPPSLLAEALLVCLWCRGSRTLEEVQRPQRNQHLGHKHTHIYVCISVFVRTHTDTCVFPGIQADYKP